MSHRLTVPSRVALAWILSPILFSLVMTGGPQEPAAAGNTIDVTTLADELVANGRCSLREAIFNANRDRVDYRDCAAGYGADTIRILSSGTITLTGELPPLESGLAIQGPGANHLIVRSDPAHPSRILRVLPSAGTVNVSGMTLAGGNAGDNSGGGILNEGSLTLDNCVVTGNTAANPGGGIHNESGTLIVLNSTISGNAGTGANGFGGGISNHLGSVIIVNTTISGNQADVSGGGISNGTGLEGPGAVSLYSVTVSNNAANTSGGGLYNAGGGTFTLKDSLLAGNRGYSGGPDCAGAMISSGFNLLGNQDGCTGLIHNQMGDQVGTSATPIEPFIAPLWENGGGTPTHALLASSPAIDRGDPKGCSEWLGNTLSSDQRGRPREVDGDGDGTEICDIGAFEYEQGRADLAVGIDDNLDWVNGGAAYTYTLTVHNAGPNVANSVTLTNNLPVSVRFGSVAGTGWTCTNSSPLIRCTLGAIAAGASSNIRVRVLAPGQSITVTDTAQVRAATLDPNTGNNTATHSTRVIAGPPPQNRRAYLPILLR